ncbi:hypothetical protein F5Y03DRAFT_355888 [Xylaria venustula]|nr:hypothetical protein F5Y03DRAFT_355888 [Xylaria venustula]
MAPAPPTRSGRRSQRSRRHRSKSKSSRGGTGVASKNRVSKATQKSGSEAASIPGQPFRSLLTAPTCPRSVEVYSTTSWRVPYPEVGQFAITADEVVAAGPSGLFSFKRLQDHVSKPWSEPRSLPDTQLGLNNQSVSGLGIYSSRWGLNVYCVSSGKLYTFYRPDDHDSFILQSPRGPFLTCLVSGIPALTYVDGRRRKDADTEDYLYEVGDDLDCYDDTLAPERWSLVIPCQSGGLLHISITGSNDPDKEIPGDNGWEQEDLVATNLGVISAVSAVTMRTRSNNETDINIVAVCIIKSQLHTVEGPFEDYATFSSWEAQTTARIHHPSEVTGNPVLLKDRKSQLDLLVPSMNGGVFHFFRTLSTPHEWHMIAHVGFPVIGPAACLGFIGSRPYTRKKKRFCAVFQSGGRLYRIQTHEASYPWSGSHIKPIVGPGPSSHPMLPASKSETSSPPLSGNGFPLE